MERLFYLLIIRPTEQGHLLDLKEFGVSVSELVVPGFFLVISFDNANS